MEHLADFGLQNDNDDDDKTTWFTFFSERQQRPYYYEPVSGETTWEVPKHGRISELPGIAPPQNTNDRNNTKPSVYKRMPCLTHPVVALCMFALNLVLLTHIIRQVCVMENEKTLVPSGWWHETTLYQTVFANKQNGAAHSFYSWDALAPLWSPSSAPRKVDTTEENIEPRLRPPTASLLPTSSHSHASFWSNSAQRTHSQEDNNAIEPPSRPPTASLLLPTHSQEDTNAIEPDNTAAKADGNDDQMNSNEQTANSGPHDDNVEEKRDASVKQDESTIQVNTVEDTDEYDQPPVRMVESEETTDSIQDDKAHDDDDDETQHVTKDLMVEEDNKNDNTELFNEDSEDAARRDEASDMNEYAETDEPPPNDESQPIEEYERDAIVEDSGEEEDDEESLEEAATETENVDENDSDETESTIASSPPLETETRDMNIVADEELVADNSMPLSSESEIDPDHKTLSEQNEIHDQVDGEPTLDEESLTSDQSLDGESDIQEGGGKEIEQEVSTADEEEFPDNQESLESSTIDGETEQVPEAKPLAMEALVEIISSAKSEQSSFQEKLKAQAASAGLDIDLEVPSNWTAPTVLVPVECKFDDAPAKWCRNHSRDSIDNVS